MNIKELKAFGYEVFEVTGWTNGKYCFRLRDEYGYFHDSYTVYKTKEKAWEGVLKWHNKNLPPEKIELLKEKMKLRDAYHKQVNAIDKKIKNLGVKK